MRQDRHELALVLNGKRAECLADLTDSHHFSRRLHQIQHNAVSSTPAMEMKLSTPCRILITMKLMVRLKSTVGGRKERPEPKAMEDQHGKMKNSFNQ